MKRCRRRGYALLLVVLSLLLLLGLYGIASRHFGSSVQVQTVRTQKEDRDQGTLEALGRGLSLLETGLPPTDPYQCATVVSLPTGPVSFTVTFWSEGGTNWGVRAAPTLASESPPPMPASF